MTSITRAAVFAASIFGAVLLSAVSWAVEPAEVRALYEDTYEIISVTLSETDPTVYEMLVLDEGGAEQVILVLVETGEIVPTEEPIPEEEVATDPGVKDECKVGGWEAFGFRNQGQCIRFASTGFDSRIIAPITDEGEPIIGAELADISPGDGTECKNGGWEALGYRNQGACVRELGE